MGGVISREFEVHSKRSDKRYKRAMQEADILHKKDKEQDEKLWEIHGRLSYIEPRS